MSANVASNHYPKLLEDWSSLDRAYESMEGKLVLSHLTAVMYSYWDAAPSGPCVYHLTCSALRPPADAVCRDEAYGWGRLRVHAGNGDFMYIVDETDQGTIIADEMKNTFYRVYGLKKTPGQLLLGVGLTLPVQTRLTALPFRGVLVFDGMMGGAMPPETVTGLAADTLKKNYARAKKKGRIITGLHVDTPARPAATTTTPTPTPTTPTAPTSMPTVVVTTVARLRAMSAAELQAFVRARVGDRLSDFENDSAPHSRGFWFKHACEVRKKVILDDRGSFDMNAPSAEYGELTKIQRKMVFRLARMRRVEGVIACRRIGYTERTNPGHVVTVIGPTGFHGVFNSEGLVPTVEEILKQLAKLGENADNCLPKIVNIDDIGLAKEVRRVAGRASIQVYYYPEPSVEETTLLSAIPATLIHRLVSFSC